MTEPKSKFEEALDRHRDHVAKCLECRLATQAAPYFGHNDRSNGCGEGKLLLLRAINTARGVQAKT